MYKCLFGPSASFYALEESWADVDKLECIAILVDKTSGTTLCSPVAADLFRLDLNHYCLRITTVKSRRNLPFFLDLTATFFWN